MVPMALRNVEGLNVDGSEGDLWWKDHRIIIIEVYTDTDFCSLLH